MRLSKTQKEILQNQLNNEKGIIDELKKVYGDAVKEIDDKIAQLQTQIGNIQQSGKSETVAASMVQSKVYQKQYQQAVRDQVSGILDKLNGAQFDSVSEYLTKCYTDGYISTMYDLSAQGLPLIMPIDQKAVVQALSTNSKLSKSLYESLGENINDMKKKVVAEISRGIAGNLSYAEIARNISGRSNAGMNRSIRIARTEGQRIQNTAAYEAQGKAKEKGANILKQWCATLDGRTRDSHRELDGKIVEVDEEFTINGVSAMFPGDFGDPAEDCNCRCCILQRANWDLGEKELDTLKERAEYYGLDKSKDFSDYKEKYLNALSGLGTGNGFDSLVPEHREPEKIKDIDFKDEKTVHNIFADFERKAVKEDIETACVITKDGEVYKCYGVPNRVFPDVDLGDKFFGAKVSHNHPLEYTMYTFSKDDIGMFLDYNLEVLRGCDEKYTYEFTKNTEELDVMPDNWRTEENYEHCSIINRAKEIGIGYRRWRNDQGTGG